MPEENIEQNNQTVDENSSEQVSIPELEAFIFDPDPYLAGVVPRNLEPPKVAQFLIEKIKADTALKSFYQVEQVAIFYDTNEVVGPYKKFLKKAESEEDDVRRSIVIARIIAQLGTAEDVEFARNYYKYLVPKSVSVEDFEDLILLHAALDLGLDSAQLRQRIEARVAELKEKKDSDYEAKLAYLKFAETTSRIMGHAEKVKDVKYEVLGHRDREKRIEQEIKAYLGIEFGFLDFLQPWAARRLRQETWANNPAEQVERNDEKPLEKEVAAAFRAFLGTLDSYSTVQEQEKESIKVRILRAVRFFGGELTEDEESFLVTFKGTQADILANEGFLLDGDQN